MNAISEDDLTAIVSGCMAWVGDLEKAGNHVFSAGLQSTCTAATVRGESGKVAVTDGPFAETKEYLAGFTVIEARDLNDAIKIASKLPSVNLGSVEVRPVMEIDSEPTALIDLKIATSIRRSLAAC